MKRIISLLFVAVICICFAGCGKVICCVEGCDNEALEDHSFEELYCSRHLADKKAFEASKLAYEYMNTAYDITEAMGSDLYNGLQRIISIKSVSQMGNAIDTLSEECLNLSEEEIKTGLGYSLAKYKYNAVWDDLSADEKNEYFKMAEEYAYSNETRGENVLFITAWTIIHAHELNGDSDAAANCLQDAKTQMQEISDKYADYKQYPNLKGYYTTVSSYYDAIVNFRMSFDEYKENYTGYRKDARDYRNDLDFIFVD